MARILLIPHDETTRSVIYLALRTAGHQLVTVAGSDTSSALAEGPYDLVIMDADRIGAERGILDGVRAVAGLAPMIVVGAQTNGEDLFHAAAAGAVDRLPKPVLSNEVVEMVEQTLAEGPDELERRRLLLTKSAEVYRSIGSLQQGARRERVRRA